MGKEFEKEQIYLKRTDTSDSDTESLGCMPENDTALLIKYAPIGSKN